MLVRTVASRELIVAINDAARTRSIRPGMTLSEARAIDSTVGHAEHDPTRDAIGLEALARWMMRFSPAVSIESKDEGGRMKDESRRSVHPSSIFLDVTGCERVFKGLNNLIDQLRAALSRMGVSAQLAIAPTPGAAWALALAGEKDGRILTADELPDALDPLPPIALRLLPEVVESLHHLGLETIGQVRRLPRSALPARFGDELLRRLDQALGKIPEPLVPLEPFSPIVARMEFDGPVSSLEAIWEIFKQLIGRVVAELTRRGAGARQIDIELTRAYESPIRKTIELSRPSREAVNLFNLLRCAVETAEEIEPRRQEGTRKRKRSRMIAEVRDGNRIYERIVPDGYIAIRLAISRFEKIIEQQIALLAHEQFAGEVELAHLIERLRIRLGHEAIARPQLVESHVPEKAWRGAGDGPRDTQPALVHLERARPLFLFRTPEPILVMVSPSDDREGGFPIGFTDPEGTVHPLRHAVGPERIGGRWWEGHHKTRDYFDVEDDRGKRFWIFRVVQSTRWFLHGRFE